MPPLTRVRHAVPLTLFLLGCGAKVVFEPQGGADGAGGTDKSTDKSVECVGSCGDPCTKCADDDCFTGTCSEDGVCTPPDAPAVCPNG